MPNTLKDSLKLARDRIKAICKLAVPESTVEVSYLAEQGATTPYTEVLMGGLTGRRRVSPEQQKLTFGMRIAITCGPVSADYDGQLQQQIDYEWIPDLAVTLEKYGGLRYPGNVSPVPFFNDTDSGYTRISKAITPLSDNRQDWQIIVDMQWVFDTRIGREC
jgi:hypothetical protein